MATLTASAQWQGGLEFANQLGDHVITTDAPEVYGGKNKGPKPTHMLLAGLMGCTGMDVAQLLTKMRVPVEAIALDSSADAADEDPRVFHSIVLNYRFDSSTDLQLYLEQITRAVGISKNKMCCVSIMFREFCTIDIHVFVNGKEVAY
jgi:putative redox protein